MYTHTKRAHTRSATETQNNSQLEGELAAAAAAAAAVLLLFRDPRCIAEHNPSQQTVSRLVFLRTHAGASNGTAATAAAGAAAAAAAAGAAVVVATAAVAAQQQQHQHQVQQQGRPKHMYE